MKRNYQVKVELDEETVKPIVAPYVKRIKELEKENTKLLKDALNIANAKLKEELEHYRSEMQLVYGKFDSQKEKHAYEAFCKKHRHPEQMKGQEMVAIPVAKIPYVIEKPTSVGTMKQVVCPICGEKKDITDIGTW